MTNNDPQTPISSFQQFVNCYFDVGILFDAEIYNLAEPARVRLKIKYPDQQIQIIVPRTSDLKLMDNINGNYFSFTYLEPEQSKFIKIVDLDNFSVLTFTRFF